MNSAAMAASTSTSLTNEESSLLEPWDPFCDTTPDVSDSMTIAYDEDEYDDVFEDAVAHPSEPEDFSIGEINLEQSFSDCDAAIKMFFNNDILGAMTVMRPWAKSSLYHSLGMAIFEFIPAMLTFDKAQINAAVLAIKQCLVICNKNRRRYTFAQNIGSIIKKPNYALYTDIEAHAELCYAEALLLQAALIVVDGEDYSSYLRGTLKIRTCYSTYQSCWDIKEKKKLWECSDSQLHFNSGVRLGTATFNLMISLLPPRIISLLEFVGFSGSKPYAIEELTKGANLPGLRAVMCDLTLLVYYLIICPFTGGEGNNQVSDEILQKTLSTYPNSVWFLALRARHEFLRGRLKQAVATYNRAIVGQEHFKQFRLLCYWELMWVHGLSLNFVSSATFAEKLVIESAWSKTTNLYIKAAMLLEIEERDMDPIQLQHIESAMSLAPRCRVRIAGKSLPMEKFVVRRCERFYRQQHRLLLPGLELLCLWNMFPILAKDKAQLHKILKMIEKAHVLIESSPINWMGDYAADNRALLSFIHGCALSAMELPRQAILELKKVLKLKRSIKEDTFLLPYAVCEMALCHYRMGDMQTSLELLNDAKKKYSGYNLETRLHFRVHARQEIVRSVIGATKFTPGGPGIKIAGPFEGRIN